MPEQVNRLDTADSVVLDADGNGTIRLGPKRPNLRWQVRNLAVMTADTGSASSSGEESVTYYVAASDQTITAVSTAISDDAELVADLAVGVHEVDIWAYFSATADFDVTTRWSVGGTMTGSKSMVGATSTAGSYTSRADTRIRCGVHGFTDVTPFQLETTGNAQLSWERGIVTVTAAGTLTYRFNKSAAVAGTLTRLAGSFMKVTTVS